MADHGPAPKKSGGGGNAGGDLGPILKQALMIVIPVGIVAGIGAGTITLSYLGGVAAVVTAVVALVVLGVPWLIMAAALPFLFAIYDYMWRAPITNHGARKIGRVIGFVAGVAFYALLLVFVLYTGSVLCSVAYATL